MLPFPWDPFSSLASEAAKTITQGWIAAMLSAWNAGLWLLRLVMTFMDAFLTPDLSETGPGAGLYRTTFWIGGALMLILTLVQLGVAVARRDGKSLGRLAIGTVQFAMVWAGILGYAVALVAAAGGLTTALMGSLLGVQQWRDWQPWAPFEVKDITDAVLATVLGLMGLFLVLAAIGHFFIMITRGAALMLLVATSPIAAAGLVGEVGRGWFWKTFRWLHAAAFTPPMVVLVMGVGVQMSQGVAIGAASGVETSVGTAFPAVMLICVSVVSPLALFKMLSFVDPGTATGAAMRAGFTASGGLQGLLTGGGGSGAASASNPEGRSAGEASAEQAQASRVTGAISSAAGVFGPVGAVLSAGIGAMMGVGQAGAAIGSDLSNQMGVGHNSYYPDFTAGGRSNDARHANNPQNTDAAPTARDGGEPGGGEPGGGPSGPPPSASLGTPGPVGPLGSPSTSPGSASGGTGGAGGAGSAAAEGGSAVELAEVAVLL